MPTLLFHCKKYNLDLMIFKISIKGHKLLKVQEENLEEIVDFTYLCSVITKRRHEHAGDVENDNGRE